MNSRARWVPKVLKQNLDVHMDGIWNKEPEYIVYFILNFLSILQSGKRKKNPVCMFSRATWCYNALFAGACSQPGTRAH